MPFFQRFSDISRELRELLSFFSRCDLAFLSLVLYRFPLRNLKRRTLVTVLLLNSNLPFQMAHVFLKPIFAGAKGTKEAARETKVELRSSALFSFLLFSSAFHRSAPLQTWFPHVLVPLIKQLCAKLYGLKLLVFVFYFSVLFRQRVLLFFLLLLSLRGWASHVTQRLGVFRVFEFTESVTASITMGNRGAEAPAPPTLH